MTAPIPPQKVPCFDRDNGAMPELGLGTFQAAGDACRQAVRTALELGYRHLDTARMYENEDQVGLGINDAGVARDEIFLTTKLQMNELDPIGVRESCEASLAALDTDYLDLLLIHWPEEDTPVADTLGTMQELRETGKVRHLGISNFTRAQMLEAIQTADVPLFCNQVEYHPYLNQGPALDTCREHGMALVAYSPLARGDVNNDDRLAEIGKKYGKSPAQVALRWLIRQQAVVAIPKGTSAAHIRENYDIFDFELEPEDVAVIDGLPKDRRLINPSWAPTWDT